MLVTGLSAVIAITSFYSIKLGLPNLQICRVYTDWAWGSLVGKLDGEEGTSVAEPPSLNSKKEIYLSGKCLFAVKCYHQNVLKLAKYVILTGLGNL